MVYGISDGIKEVCYFCGQRFDNINDRNDHIFGHFERKRCFGCDHELISIGDVWYQPHDDITCNGIKVEPIDYDHSTAIGFEERLDTYETIEYGVKAESAELSMPIENMSDMSTVSGENDPLDEIDISLNVPSTSTEPMAASSVETSETLMAVAKRKQFTCSECNLTLHSASGLGRHQKCCFRRNKRTRHEVANFNDEDEIEPFRSDDDSVDPLNQEMRQCERFTAANSNADSSNVRHSNAADKCRSEYNAEAWICGACPKLFHWQRNAHKHLQLVHGSRDRSMTKLVADIRTMWYCGLCFNTFPLRKNIIRHLRNLHSSDDINLAVPIQDWQDPDELKLANGDHLPCDYCPKTFTDKNDLYVHLLDRHTDQLQRKRFIKCAQCPALFFEQNLHQIHSIRVHGQLDELYLEKWECLICGKSFQQLHAFVTHLQGHGKRDEYICCIESCDECFESISELRAHLTKHPIQLELTSVPRAISVDDLLGPEADVPTSTSKSRQSEYVADAWSCGICLKLFNRERNAHKHLRAIHGTTDRTLANSVVEIRNLWYCSLCFNTFPWQKNLNRHMRNIHFTDDLTLGKPIQDWQDPDQLKLDEGQKLPCDYCATLFTDKNELHTHARDRHMYQLNKCGIIKCTQCPAIFKESNLHQIHSVKVHGGLDKLYLDKWECIVCGKSFQQLSPYLAHLAEHRSTAGYICCIETCDEHFAAIDELRAHLTEHQATSMDKYSVTDVPAALSRRSKERQNLIRIAATAGDSTTSTTDKSRSEYSARAWICGACPKLFNWQRNAHKHLQLIHGSVDRTLTRPVADIRTMWYCSICFNTFPWQKNMYRHLRNIHQTNDISLARPIQDWTDPDQLKLNDGEHLQCDYCSRKFVDKRVLHGHMRDEHMDQLNKHGIIKCGQCAALFYEQNLHQIHSINVHGSLDKIYLDKWECIVCGKSFQQLTSFIAHLTEHGPADEYICCVESCDERFDTIQRLRLHLRKHPAQAEKRLGKATDDPSAEMGDEGEQPMKCEVEQSDSAVGGNSGVSNSDKCRAEYNVDAWLCSACPNLFNSERNADKHFRLMHESTGRRSMDLRSTGRQSMDQGSMDQRSTGRRSVDQGSMDQGSMDRRSTDQGSMDRRSTTQGSTDRRSTDQQSTTQGSTNRRSTTLGSSDHQINDDSKATPATDTRTMWYCSLCFNTFPVRKRMYRHLRNLHHTDDITLARPIQDWEDPDQVKLNNGQQLPCDYCSKTFMDKDALHLHMRGRHMERLKRSGILQCSQCPAIFKEQNLHQIHSIVVHGRLDKAYLDKWECIVCGKPFHHLSPYMVHLAEHGPMDEYVCCIESCDRRLDTLQQMHSHLNDHPTAGVSKRECKLCKGSFTAARFSSHPCGVSTQIFVPNLMGPKRFICPICDLELSARSALSRHKKLCYRKNPQKLRKTVVSQSDELEESAFEECEVDEYRWVKEEIEGDAEEDQMVTDIPSAEEIPSATFNDDLSASMEDDQLATKENHSNRSFYKEADADDDDDEPVACQTSSSEYNVQVWSCGLCPKVFNWKQSADKHLRLIHGCADAALLKLVTDIRSMWYCAICQHTFSVKFKVSRHLRAVHDSDDKTLIQPIHSWRDPNQSPLADGKKATCDYCWTAFADRHSLNIHKRTSHMERLDADAVRKCQLCPALFGDQISHQIHSIRVHGTLDPQYLDKYECIVCGKSFKLLPSFVAHLTDHGDMDDYVCCLDSCDEHFRSLQLLQAHLKEHPMPEKRRRRCDKCSSNFSDAEFAGHHCSPAQSKTFFCEYCGKQFFTLQTLKMHLNRHTGEKVYNCSYCSKTFFGASGRDKHQFTHTGEKPCKCLVANCGRAFGQHTDLYRHQFKAHGIFRKKFPCTQCDKVFPENSLLRKHSVDHGVRKAK